ncbi:amino acid adenylation domain-containing protein [Leifsonia shinshuensis]|uniref:amino acid adenylation domain-containing protein n=1 Tax=Leifsonia shinshuensis TaxID=150026 RepID=UPI001F50896B|nr:amino acid adenylation domain-containing protein [Leifsonia shinshuensis]MCI0158114.1 amino acid adenylation domain-containing protein [Leifsonia shinshuensis]
MTGLRPRTQTEQLARARRVLERHGDFPLVPDLGPVAAATADQVREEVTLNASTRARLQTLAKGRPALELTVALAAVSIAGSRFSAGSRTLIAAGLDDHASVMVNHRARPDDSLRSVLERTRLAMAECPAIENTVVADVLPLREDGVLAAMRVRRASDTAESSALFALEVVLDVSERAVTITVTVAAHTASQQGVRRFTGMLADVITTGLADPAGTIPEQSSDELATLNGFASGAPLLPSPLLSDRVRAIAARHPHSPAIELADESTIDYGELDARVDRLVGSLARLGVDPGTTVGVMTDPALNALLAMLAIGRLGATFVPLDPAYPADRLGLMITESGSAAVLGDAPPVPDGVRTIPYDDLESAASHVHLPPTGRPDVHREGLAYVIFTSGSTGKPKGVGATHGGLADIATASAATLRIDSSSRVLHFASRSFDMLVGEVMATLVVGGTVVIPRRDERGLGSDYAALLRRRAITHAFATPAVWLTVPPTVLPELRVILMGGEAVPTELARRWLADDRVVFNAYGPTETIFIATSEAANRDEELNIGSPLPGVRCYVAGSDGHRMPIGAMGELLIGGAGVARGYLNAPGLTAERFVPDPWGPPGSRLYRTGDNARLLDDGRIEFLGRADKQVKLRGYRIELGEIESAIREIPGVDDCAVLVTDEAGGRSLTAFVVASASVRTLRDSVTARLPAHLRPQRYTAISAIPMTVNGKRDDSALHAAATMHAMNGERAGRSLERAQSAAAGHDPIEAALQRIWSRLLGVPIDIDDDFFALGGHSLLALSLQEQLHQETGISVPLAALFRNPTIRSLAARMRSIRHRPESPLISLNEPGGFAPVVFIHPSGGDVLCYMPLAEQWSGQRAVYALQDPELDGGRAIDRMEDLALHYRAVLRERFPATDVHLAGWSLGGLIAAEMTSQLEREDTAPLSLTVLDSAVPELLDLPDEEDSGSLLLTVVRRLEAISGEVILDRTPHDFLSMPTDEQLVFAAESAKRHGLLGASADATSVLNRLAVLRRHDRLLRRWSPSPVSVPLAVVRATQQERSLLPPDLGWRAFARGPVRCSETPGDHMTMMSGRFLSPLAATLHTAFESSLSSTAQIGTR